PEPTGTWYWLLGPCSLASGVLAILAGRRNLQLQSRGLGLFALGLLGLSGLGAYKVPTGIIISGLGIYIYQQREAKDAFLQKVGGAGNATWRSTDTGRAERVDTSGSSASWCSCAGSSCCTWCSRVSTLVTRRSATRWRSPRRCGKGCGHARRRREPLVRQGDHPRQ